MTTLPRSRLEWMLAAFLAVVLAVALCASGVILLAGFGIIRAPAWIFWLNAREYLTAAAFSAAIGIWLLFRQTLK